MKKMIIFSLIATSTIFSNVDQFTSFIQHTRASMESIKRKATAVADAIRVQLLSQEGNQTENQPTSQNNLIQSRSGCLPTSGEISSYEEYRQHLQEAKEWEIYYKAQGTSIPDEYQEMIKAYRNKATLYEQQLKREDTIDHEHPLSLETRTNNYKKSLEIAHWNRSVYEEAPSAFLFYGLQAAEYQATADLYLAEIQWHVQQENKDYRKKRDQKQLEWVRMQQAAFRHQQQA